MGMSRAGAGRPEAAAAIWDWRGPDGSEGAPEGAGCARRRGALRSAVVAAAGLALLLLGSAVAPAAEAAQHSIGFGAHFWKTVDELGFHGDLQFYSYRYGHAKPGKRLYVLAAEALELHGILPSQTLFVGNDLLNDIMPAKSVGFQTALFAGDRRSLRLREDDSRVAGLVPDVIITELADLADCV